MTLDLLIIGAGPAGLAAAIEAQALGLATLVLDEQATPGGQVFRSAEAAAADPALAADLAPGLALIRAFRASGAAYRPATTLWHLDPETGEASVSSAGSTETLTARRILLATGAQERPVPIPGWTLPGAMGAGAAQIMLKSAGAVPRGRCVLAGQGPLIWLLAVQLARAGAPPALILSTTPQGRWRQALRAGGLWQGRALLSKGFSLLAEIRRHRIPVLRAATGLRAEGDSTLRRVAWDGGSADCETLLLHQGVIPATQISRAIGLDHSWDAAQQCWRPDADEFGATSEPLVAIAGDGAGIGGWQAAVAAGRLAAIDAAHRLGMLGPPSIMDRAAPLLRDRRRALALRPFLDALYAPPVAPLDDATNACRCEEVTAGQVRAAARLGATGPNQLKAFLRCGMGPCQGRMCATTVAALIAEVRGVPVQDIPPLRPRAPYKPVTVGELGAAAGQETVEEAGVDRRGDPAGDTDAPPSPAGAGEGRGGGRGDAGAASIMSPSPALRPEMGVSPVLEGPPPQPSPAPAGEGAGRIIIVGAGPAGRAAAEVLPAALLIARPTATAFHAEPNLLWIEESGALRAEPFARLLLCADEPLLLAQLGAAFDGLRPRVDPSGATSLPGIACAGRILGAKTPEEAARQGRIAARSLAGLPPEGTITAQPIALPPPQADADILCACLNITAGEARAHLPLGPAGIARLLGLNTGECRMRRCRLPLASLCPDRAGEALLPLSPARPLPFAALAALAPAEAPPKPPQQDTAAWPSPDRSPAGHQPPTNWDAIVVGGGLHGLSAALHLARRGQKVLVLEKDSVAAHASGFSAGGVRTLGRDLAEIPLALEAVAQWRDIAALVGDDCGFRTGGQVRVAETPQELRDLEARAATLRARGWHHERLVDAAELRRLLPAAASHLLGGIFAEQDGFATPFRATQAFRRAAEASGATVREAARVIGADRSGGGWHVRIADGTSAAAPILVNTAGAWAGQLARSLHEEIPLGFAAFMMLLTAPMAPFLTPVVGASGRPLSFKQLANGQVMIGGGHKGTAELDRGRTTLDIPRLAYSARTALDLFPILSGTQAVHAWAGIEGVLPDDLPVIGLSPRHPGLVHAFGFCGHGFALAPLVGGVVAQLALDGATNMPIEAFRPDRFAQSGSLATALPQPAG